MPILHLHRLNRILCLLAVLVLGSLTVAPAAYAHTLTVCPSGCDFTAIQPAIDSASSGDTIRIFSGVYLGGNGTVFRRLLRSLQTRVSYSRGSERRYLTALVREVARN